jgi:nucleotide-binding universal stress UspA family protein
VLAQDPADGLVAAARHVDMLVMGSRAYGPKRAVLLGSVSRQVMERARCPVLIIPRGASEATATLLADAETRGPV